MVWWSSCFLNRFKYKKTRFRIARIERIPLLVERQQQIGKTQLVKVPFFCFGSCLCWKVLALSSWSAGTPSWMYHTLSFHHNSPNLNLKHCKSWHAVLLCFCNKVKSEELVVSHNSKQKTAPHLDVCPPVLDVECTTFRCSNISS